MNNTLNKKKMGTPPENIYKINIDDAFKTASSRGGWVFAVRNNSGQYLQGGCDNLTRRDSPLQAEALAALYNSERAH